MIPPLDAPELDVSVSGTSLTLTWEEVSEADRYEVQEDRSGWGTVRRTTGLTATFSGLTVGRAYTYRVCSYRGIDRLTVCSGGQTWSIDPTPRPTPVPTPTPTPLPTPPAPSLTVTVPPPNGDVHTIDVSWLAIGGVTSYEIAYGPTEGSEQSRSTYQSTSMDVTPGCGVTTYFKGRSYGNGTRYADWGAWSSDHGPYNTAACTPTPGPTATPTGPTSAVIYRVIDGSPAFPIESPTMEWWVLQQGTLVVRIDGTDLKEYEYNLFTSKATGFYVRDYEDIGCDPLSKHETWTGWGDLEGEDSPLLYPRVQNSLPPGNPNNVQTAQFAVRVIRCGVGDVINLGMELRARPIGVDSSDELTILNTGHIAQAWHRTARAVTYEFDLANDHRRSRMENGTRAAVAGWHYKISKTYFTPSRNADVTIETYVRGNSGDPECPKTYGCLSYDKQRAPHFDGQEHRLWIYWPPWPSGETDWTNELYEAKNKPGQLYYLPQIIAHELGHAMGIGHLAAAAEGIMSAYNPHALVPVPSLQDVRGFLLVDVDDHAP